MLATNNCHHGGIFRLFDKKLFTRLFPENIKCIFEPMHSYFKYIDTNKSEEKIRTMVFPSSRNLFWDAEIEKIDLKKNSRYIIERVLTRGFTEDFYMLLKIYTTQEIQEALCRSKELDPKTAHFFSTFFNIPKSELNVSCFYKNPERD